MTSELMPPPAAGESVEGWWTRRDAARAAVCAVVMLVAIAATWPVGGLGFNDDPSYAVTARTLAETGRVEMNGWATAAVILQAAWGALFVKAFGYSPTVLRLSMAPVAAAAVAAAFALCRRCGVRRPGATFTAVALGLSPVFLPLAASFMTDVTGVLFVMLGLLAVVSAALAEGAAAAVGWVVIAVVLAAVGGTARQTAWVPALAGLPWVAVSRWRERAVAVSAVAGVAAVLVAAEGTIHWFLSYPYAIPEGFVGPGVVRRFAHDPAAAISLAWALVLTLVLVALPIVVWAVGRAPEWRRPPAWQWATFAVVLGGLWVARRHWRIPATAPWMGNTLTWEGVLGSLEAGVGRPPMLPGFAWVAVSLAVYVVVAAAVAVGVRWGLETARLGRRQVWTSVRAPAHRVTMVLLLFVGLYTVLVLPRCVWAVAYDRYVLPVVPCVAILLLRGRAAGPIDRWARACRLTGWAVLAAFGLVGVAATQDVLALGRARMAAVDQLRARGVPNTRIDGGWEFNLATQIAAWGYVNDKRLLNPPGAFDPTVKLNLPAVDAEYVILWPRLARPGLVPTDVPDVRYFSLLPPFHRRLAVWRMVVPPPATVPLPPRPRRR